MKQAYFLNLSTIYQLSNGKESTVNRALGGSAYAGKKLACSSLYKKILVVMKHSNLYLGLVLPSDGWQSVIANSWSRQIKILYLIKRENLNYI